MDVLWSGYFIPFHHLSPVSREPLELQNWWASLARAFTAGYEGGGCLVIDLLMETVVSILGSIRKGDVMFMINLKDVYFQALVYLDSLPYLQFLINGKVFPVPGSLLCPFFWLPRSSPECSPWYQSGPINRGFVSFTTSTTGWW